MLEIVWDIDCDIRKSILKFDTDINADLTTIQRSLWFQITSFRYSQIILIESEQYQSSYIV